MVIKQPQPAVIGTIIKPYPVKLRVIEVDVDPIITTESIVFNILLRFLNLLCFFLIFYILLRKILILNLYYL